MRHGFLALTDCWVQSGGFSFLSAVGVFAQPKIELESETLRFGKVNVGTVLDLKYQIKNVGDEVLNLTKVSTSCGCTVAGEWPETLEPASRRLGGAVRYD